jgi:predicted phage tail protein
MNWDKANLYTKVGALFLLQGLLLFGICAAALSVGALTLMLLKMGQSRLAGIAALLSGVSTYLGLLPGRTNAMARLTIWLFSAPAEPPK